MCGTTFQSSITTHPLNIRQILRIIMQTLFSSSRLTTTSSAPVALSILPRIFVANDLRPREAFDFINICKRGNENTESFAASLGRFVRAKVTTLKAGKKYK